MRRNKAYNMLADDDNNIIKGIIKLSVLVVRTVSDTDSFFGKWCTMGD